MTDLTAPLTIRLSAPDDQLAIARLAALDSTDGLPVGAILLAEVDGELRAAVSLHDGTAIADPFYRTTEIIALLRRYITTMQRARRRRLSDYLGTLAARPASALAGRS